MLRKTQISSAESSMKVYITTNDIETLNDEINPELVITYKQTYNQDCFSQNPQTKRDFLRCMFNAKIQQAFNTNHDSVSFLFENYAEFISTVAKVHFYENILQFHDKIYNNDLLSIRDWQYHKIGIIHMSTLARSYIYANAEKSILFKKESANDVCQLDYWQLVMQNDNLKKIMEITDKKAIKDIIKMLVDLVDMYFIYNKKHSTTDYLFPLYLIGDTLNPSLLRCFLKNGSSKYFLVNFAHAVFTALRGYFLDKYQEQLPTNLDPSQFVDYLEYNIFPLYTMATFINEDCLLHLLPKIVNSSFSNI